MRSFTREGDLRLAVDAFACPPDCGHCCTHLERPPPPDEARALREFRALLREHGVYHCGDATHVGLSLSPDEAARLRARADERGMRVRLHPRTFLLETRRRIAVVLDWHLPYVACPFHDAYRCTVYADRPRVCRAYPVMTIGPVSLAPECPKVPIPTSALRVESRARREIERDHAQLDAEAMEILALPGTRFSTGLGVAQASARARRWRAMSPAQFREVVASQALATRSTR